MPSESTDWYARNADRTNPRAFINTDPAYFASECASAVMKGDLTPPYRAPAGKVPPENFCGTLAANVDNEKLSDAEFRQFVRNSLAVVDLPTKAAS